MHVFWWVRCEAGHPPPPLAPRVPPKTQACVEKGSARGMGSRAVLAHGGGCVVWEPGEGRRRVGRGVVFCGCFVGMCMLYTTRTSPPRDQDGGGGRRANPSNQREGGRRGSGAAPKGGRGGGKRWRGRGNKGQREETIEISGAALAKGRNGGGAPACARKKQERARKEAVLRGGMFVVVVSCASRRAALLRRRGATQDRGKGRG